MQASEIAARADVDRLLLVHLPPGLTKDDLRDARVVFENTELGQESGAYDI
jgi:ribonuclease Z